jgi:hypothetical protein
MQMERELHFQALEKSSQIAMSTCDCFANRSESRHAPCFDEKPVREFQAM